MSLSLTFDVSGLTYVAVFQINCIITQEVYSRNSLKDGETAKQNNADNDAVSTYQVSSVQLVTDKKLEALNKA